MEQPRGDAPVGHAPAGDVPVDDMDVVALCGRYQAALLRVATGYVGSRALAEEVVQDAWLGALAGRHRFQARSSLKTWVFRILENRARSTARREARSVPVASLGDEPAGGTDTPEARLLLAELRRLAAHAISALPPRERAVLTLRAQGASAREVCDRLQISAANQRVTLHRARSKLLARLGPYLAAESGGRR